MNAVKKNRIFLSYRRDDSPGYVSRLEGELERVFGIGRVFRDATDIVGGTKWKNVIDANLHSSAVLLLIIGPRWEHIWNERKNDDVNYVAIELERARELDVPIIPVTLDGSQLSNDLDLGSINFIYDYQFHDLSDKQNRWNGDVAGLVSLLELIPGIGAAQSKRDVSALSTTVSIQPKYKWLATMAGLFVIMATLYTLGDMSWLVGDPDARKPVDQAVEKEKSIAERTETPKVVLQQAKDTGQVAQASQTDLTSIATQPNINGTWRDRHDVAIVFQQFEDGSFHVESPNYGSGGGRFLDRMPGKFEIDLSGIGRGEFSVSSTGDKAMGWFVVNGQQEFNTLLRVD